MENSDGNKNPNEFSPSNPIPIPSTTGSRTRNDSEPSCSDDGNKRQRTAQQFMVTSGAMIGASPPKFVSLEEIMQAANGMSNMALVHQIAVDNEFKLNPVALPDNSIQKTLADTMKRAFWDLLRQDLSKSPPVYSHALQLLEDIKQGLFSVLLPQHTKIKQTIDEVLDSSLIRQQVDAGTLDFKHYANYVINVMSKLCAPIRDENIKDLSETDDVVESFKGILETLDLMALDMANFTLNVARPNIIAQSVDYEREKFADFLKIQPDGLCQTRNWLQRHCQIPTELIPELERPARIKSITTDVLNRAYMELLEGKSELGFPETLSLDEDRLEDLQIRICRLSVIGAILLVLASNVSIVQTDLGFKEDIKNKIVAILHEVPLDEQLPLQEALTAVGEICTKELQIALEKNNCTLLNQDAERLLMGQIFDIARVDHKIRKIIRNRVMEFLQQIISSPTAAPEKLPPGLSSLQNELFSVAGNFLRIVSHNRSVFGQYYIDIVDATIST